jgi:hypothetical protein
MDAVDGNAIGGQLLEYFGTEMTAASGTCAYCGATAQIAELVVYTRAPGSVVRCRKCGNVVIVIVAIRGALRADFSGFRLRDQRVSPRRGDPSAGCSAAE